MVYKPMKLALSKGQKMNAVKSKPIRLMHNQLNSGNEVILLHPVNYQQIQKAMKHNRGVTLQISPGEIEATKSSDLQGTGIFDFVKKGWDWVKNNWSSIKPVVSTIADVIAPTLGPEAVAVRQGVKAITGVGLKKQRKPRGSGLYVSRPTGNGLYV